MIWKLAEAGTDVARMNMSHGGHTSHQKVIDLAKEYNNEHKDNVITIMVKESVMKGSTCSAIVFQICHCVGFGLASTQNLKFLF
ncbi:hypothetical protein DCAR_0520783 [Daucus carota subsp. sativus]|uniref:Pyruvate kinase barrel domain-containing protein n=1 Tax=Daucus carota subsp. sativus TaxID=79200 RepID=A0AAF1B2Y3_DAUCS|nr:hypothetical protein DCAR_0520783 [Daucus carota subsp. sativus]